MRAILLLLLIFIGFSTFGQDTLIVDFNSLDETFGQMQENKLSTYIKKRGVEQVGITCFVSKEGSVSNNRITNEMRLQKAMRLLEKKGVTFNKIQSTILVEDSSDNWNKMKFAFLFSNNYGEKVLKKTSIVQISEVDYRPMNSLPIVVEKPKKQEEKKLLDVSSFKKNEIIQLPDLLFENSTHYILPSSERVLYELLSIMLNNKKLKIELQGHICCRKGGGDGYDPVSGRQNLSEMRARAVYEFLIKNGVASSRMSYRGFGSSRKLFPFEINEMQMALNRRVEILVVETD